MSIAITGGAGFLGSHVVEHLLLNTNEQIYLIDKLDTATFSFERVNRFRTFENRINLLALDFTKPISEGVVELLSGVTCIIHLGAQTHVDTSITNPMAFVEANVVGTCNMLELARRLPYLQRFFYFSTDEVFGPAPEGVNYKEWDRYNSTNPYAATKAGGEELALAYANTYGLPVTVTHCMNIFGERQHFEKFIPLCINRIESGEEIQVHSDRTCTRSGSRFYIHARNVADALFYLTMQTDLPKRDKFNIVGEKEVTNEEVVKLIGKILNKEPKYKLIDFHSSRPGHDLRYALDGDKLKSLGWEPPKTFEESLEKTVNWYINNPKWLGELR